MDLATVARIDFSKLQDIKTKQPDNEEVLQIVEDAVDAIVDSEEYYGEDAVGYVESYSEWDTLSYFFRPVYPVGTKRIEFKQEDESITYAASILDTGPIVSLRLYGSDFSSVGKKEFEMASNLAAVRDLRTNFLRFYRQIRTADFLSGSAPFEDLFFPYSDKLVCNFIELPPASVPFDAIIKEKTFEEAVSLFLQLIISIDIAGVVLSRRQEDSLSAILLISHGNPYWISYPRDKSYVYSYGGVVKISDYRSVSKTAKTASFLSEIVSLFALSAAPELRAFFSGVGQAARALRGPLNREDYVELAEDALEKRGYKFNTFYQTRKPTSIPKEGRDLLLHRAVTPVTEIKYPYMFFAYSSETLKSLNRESRRLVITSLNMHLRYYYDEMVKGAETDDLILFTISLKRLKYLRYILDLLDVSSYHNRKTRQGYAALDALLENNISDFVEIYPRKQRLVETLLQ